MTRIVTVIVCTLLSALSGCPPPVEYRQLPKVELHVHLDCSLSYEVVKQLDSTITLEEYRHTFIAPAKCTNLADYIKRADRGIALMQTREQLRLVTLDLLRQLRADNVVYAEIRFAPLLHTAQGLTPAEVVEVVNSATEEGVKTYGLEAGVILCTLRHFTEAQSMETARLVHRFKGTRIVALDLAADEGRYPITNHIKAFEFAHARGLYCTAHAGEARGAESVWETLRYLRPSRLGHGVRSAEDTALLSFLKAHNVHLEVCPTSNVQTNVYDQVADHPADLIYNRGLSMSINTDSRTIAHTTLTREYELMAQVFRWDKAHFKRCNLEAVDHAFTTPATRQKIRNQIEAAY